MYRLKRSLADRLFSDLVRIKANWTCERCNTKYEPPTSALHCSHYFGRGGKSTRWDFDNAAAICYGCHRYLGSNPIQHMEFFLKRLGQKRHDALVVRAKTPTKVDEKMIAIALKEELKKLKEKSKENILGAR